MPSHGRDGTVGWSRCPQPRPHFTSSPGSCCPAAAHRLSSPFYPRDSLWGRKECCQEETSWVAPRGVPDLVRAAPLAGSPMGSAEGRRGHGSPKGALCLWELGWMVLTGPFQLETFYDSFTMVTWNHRTMEWFGWEGTFKGHLVQRCCHEQGHLHPDQVAQSPVHPGLECFQRSGINHLSGQLVLGFHHPQHEKLPPYIWSESPLFQFITITPCPNTTACPHLSHKPPLSTERPE